MSYIINVIGNRCTGKTRLAKAISQQLNIPFSYMELSISVPVDAPEYALVLDHTGVGACLIWQMPYDHVLTIRCDIPMHDIKRNVCVCLKLNQDDTHAVYNEVDRIDEALPAKLKVDHTYNYTQCSEHDMIEDVKQWVAHLPHEATNAYK